MLEVECPHCLEEVELEGEDLPSSACDESKGHCPSCDSPVVIGWYATATMRKAD